MNKIRTLIVDDDPKIAEIHHRFTQKVNGFEVVGIATSIKEARELIEVLEPDLILLDIYFPQENGIDLLWEIRSRQKPVDIVLITAAKEIEPLRQAMRGGVFDYIIKPALISRFQATLQRYLKTREQMVTIGSIDQQTADQITKVTTTETALPPVLPKGIDAISLAKVRKVFADYPNAKFSADQVGLEIGMSRSSARRYLEYLFETGWLGADISYGIVGRPERNFFKVSSS